MTRLIDASVAVKWVVSEPDSERAMALYGGGFAAPDLILVEIANILWKKVRRREIDALQATLGLSELQSTLDVMPTLSLESRALEIGMALDHPVYDCIYLALAEALDTTLVTADTRLLRCCTDTPFGAMVEPLP